VGRVTLSDRGGGGACMETGAGRRFEAIFKSHFSEALEFDRRLIPDERGEIERTLRELCDTQCTLIVTTGGTGPASARCDAGSHGAVIGKGVAAFLAR